MTRVHGVKFFLLILVTGACSQQTTFEASSAAQELGTSIITINGGAAYTNKSDAVLHVSSPKTDEMILSLTPNCESSEGWTKQFQTKTVRLPKLNSQNSYYAKFRNKTTLATDCIKASIIQDNTGPVIDLAGPTVNTISRSAAFTLAVKDTAPGTLRSVRCVHRVKEKDRDTWTEREVDCIHTKELSYQDLAYGEHEVIVHAKDEALNESEVTKSWMIKRVICDPFSTDNTNCRGGLAGSLYYLTKPLQDEFNSITNKTVKFFFDRGVRIDADVSLSKLFTPTRRFNEGFPAGDGGMIKDDQGNALIEYFSLQLSSIVKLDTDNPDVSLRNPSGLYQFATLSDDGTLLRVQTNPSNTNKVEIINNDGDHPPRLACSTQNIQMNTNTRLPIELDYYQGPRDFIALMFLWRKVDASTPQEPFCGKDGEELFFGPDPYNNFTNQFGYGQMLERGWRPLINTNFISPKQ